MVGACESALKQAEKITPVKNDSTKYIIDRKEKENLKNIMGERGKIRSVNLEQSNSLL